MDHLIISLGVLLGGSAVLVTILRFFKQSNILAFIGVGVLAGLYRDQLELPHELLETFTEVGIIMLLFMAGLELDISNLLKRWRLVAINGLGQIVLFLLVSMGVVAALLPGQPGATVFYFALCLTLSSTIIVLDTLKQQNAMESLHGQIILGLMVLQDLIAVISLSVLQGIASGAPLGQEIALIFGKMALLIFLLVLLERYLLAPIFKLFAQSGETLFIGSLGYCMAIAALCEVAHFSPEIGAFLAGASLALSPYRLEIEGHVTPLKTFGVILFFITLGFNLKVDSSMLEVANEAVILTLFVVLFTPLLMLFLGWVTRLKGRLSFLTGMIINQISEFSLILATLCHQAGVFDDRMLVLITLVCLGTFFLSCLGHQYLEKLHHRLRNALKWLDQRSFSHEVEKTGFELQNHVVILSFNEIAQEIADYFSKRGEKVLLIDLDPDITHHFAHETGHNLVPVYGDMYNPEVWETYRFHQAKIVISCLIKGQAAEIAISKWLKRHGPQVPFLATTDSHQEALELYENGVRYVIQTEYLAAENVHRLFQEEMQKGLDAFKEPGKTHYAVTLQFKEGLGSIFRLI